MMTKIYCQPTDCDNCKYSDCVGTIRQKPGRKPLSEEERRKRRNERSKVYYYKNQERLQEYGRNYYATHKKSNRNNRPGAVFSDNDLS